MANFVDCSDVDEKFKDTPIRGDVPDGVYQADIVAAGVEYLQGRTPRRVWKWKFEITDGDYLGTTIDKVMLIREDLFKWIKIDFSKLQFPHHTLNEAQRYVGDVLGLSVEIKVTTKQDNNGQDRQNVWINKLLTTNDSPPKADYESPSPEDGIPF